MDGTVRCSSVPCVCVQMSLSTVSKLQPLAFARAFARTLSTQGVPSAGE